MSYYAHPKEYCIGLCDYAFSKFAISLNLNFFKGASTAMLGKEAAMACTVAVEESISEHYNSQMRTLMEEDPDRYTELLKVSALS